ncbi:MAG: alpha amylase catalytic region [uncultured bacterium]|nr:MAG: alpha amylase catalytic region [uncultured bacterium]HBH18689.1 hypothetical protein [Cyanobacteria bacterium UBA9579]
MNLQNNYSLNNRPAYRSYSNTGSVQAQIGQQFPYVINPAAHWQMPSMDLNAQAANTLRYLNNLNGKVYPNATTSTVAQTQTSNNSKTAWKNDLRELFHENKAVIYAMVMRTFNAKDQNGNGLIDTNNGEQTGTFLNAIERLDELKSLGINTLHVLPIHPPGKKGAMGIAGSVYAPLSYLEVDSKLDDPNSPLGVKEEAKLFMQEAHKRGIRVMLDLPSCASIDLYESQPELMAIDAQGNPKVPQGWQDIRMFSAWKDAEQRKLNNPLLDMHKKFVDLSIELGFDGIRADVARAKPVEFWAELIDYARSKDPNFAFLAESYTYEDASPIANIPADRPEELLKVGFDSYYGQYHIFNQMKNAKEFHDNMILNLEMSRNLPPNKSLIGSFATHDDKSPMANGGVLYSNLTTGLQATLPMTNPYFVTGFESGDRYLYPYKDKTSANSDTDSNKFIVHPEMLDIFNYSRKPGGKHPEVGQFMSKMFKTRKQYEDVITEGSYIPLKVQGNKNDQIIAYARHLNGKTLLVIANKDVNAKQTGQVSIPTLKSSQLLVDVAPHSGLYSKYTSQKDAVNVELAPAAFHVFEIQTPDIEKHIDKIYRQNLLLTDRVTTPPKKVFKTSGQYALDLYNKTKTSR